jgi:pyruvate/2-oxoglutarate/acetoin dehydrogenase E1 component
MAVRTFIEAIRETLVSEMRRDESIIVLGEDVGKKGGVFLATDGLWSEFGEERVIDTPLTESMIIGASIGAAVNGLRPVCEIQFADFIFPAFNQIVSEAARMRYRSNNGYGVPLVIRAPFGGGVHGALYHSQSVEASSRTYQASRWSSPPRRTTLGVCSARPSGTRTRCSSSSTRRCTARCAARCRTPITSCRSARRR